MPVTRIHHGATQTRVDEYRHPDNGKIITLVGMVHIATPQYYKEVAAFAARLVRTRGAQVHYEMTKRPVGDEEMTDAERELIARLRANRNTEAVAELLGLVTQYDLPILAGWVNTDITTLDLIRTHRYPDMLVSDSELLRDVLEDPQRRAIVGRLMLFIYRRIGLFSLLRDPISRLTKKGREHQRVLIGVRNQIAIQAAIAAPGSVVALWGGEHLAGIGNGLREHGYSRYAYTWLDAIPAGYKLPEQGPEVAPA